MGYLAEYNRLVKVGPSLAEAAAEPMLDALSRAFSAKVRRADVGFLRYRKVGKGVELADRLERLGGILTSVEPDDADPRELVAYLKKHGAKPMKAEKQEESTRYVVMRGDEAEAVYKIKGTGNRGWVFAVKTSDGGKTWEKVRGFDDHKGTGLRDAYAWLDKQSGLKRMGKLSSAPRWLGKEESLDEAEDSNPFVTGNAKLDSAVKWLVRKASKRTLSDGSVTYFFQGKLPGHMVDAFRSKAAGLKSRDMGKVVVLNWSEGDLHFALQHGAYKSTYNDVRFSATDERVPAAAAQKESLGEAGLGMAALMALGDQSGAEGEADEQIVGAFKKNIRRWTAYLEKLTGTTWSARVGEVTVDFQEAFGKKRSIGVYWDYDVGSRKVTFYVEGPRGGTVVVPRKAVTDPGRPEAPKEFFHRVEQALREAVLASSESGLTEVLKSEVPIYQVVRSAVRAPTLGGAPSTLTLKWYVYGVGPGTGPFGEAVRFGPFRSEAEAKKEAVKLASRGPFKGRVLRKVETSVQKALDRFGKLSNKMAGPPQEEGLLGETGAGTILQQNESLNESEKPAHIILKQMGGSGRLRAMVGAKHFTSHEGGLALSFQFPNRQRSKGNYVKITLRSDDTYDMEFSKIVKYEAKPVKTYRGIMWDQLKSVFERQTGLYLSL